MKIIDLRLANLRAEWTRKFYSQVVKSDPLTNRERVIADYYLAQQRVKARDWLRQHRKTKTLRLGVDYALSGADRTVVQIIRRRR